MSVTAQCAAAMLPAATAPSHSLDKTATAPAALNIFAAPLHGAGTQATFAPAARVYPPSISVNIRFCTFLE
ncbi:MAG TPA: hypothetical protein VGT99_10895 [Gammaproteobacteria bacterium]|nr:hypothetical protein [Gammaproteobacteria bacterium]